MRYSYQRKHVPSRTMRYKPGTIRRGSILSTAHTGGTITLTDDLTISRMGYGTMQLAGPGVFGPPKDRDEAIAVLREAVALGITHIDTSDFYGPSSSTS